MADLKLYSFTNGKANSIQPSEFKLEREIQKLCETNLEVFFGIKFLASEYSTGNKHKGRIDTLGIDENNCPVIIEYKLDSKENVINQGLFYLDWLMDHKADFEMICFKTFDKTIEVDWSNPRLLCIARDFTKYDDYAIGQINRNIELIRYRIFEEQYVLFELASTVQQKESISSTSQTKYKGIADYRESAGQSVIDMITQLEDFIFSLGDDVQKKELKYYYAYSRIRNFVCLEIIARSKALKLYLKQDFKSIKDPSENMRDVSEVGHYGTGDTEIIINNLDELEKAKKHIEDSYNLS
ncbi:DUF5655 domain-containing protein [Fulvivirga lutimaris]|uniref:DUF5655 domain-containing protein n=1 Tax=Fulvivirga lutimaris TaxID=1819566 RepID=UPI0012BC9E8D|nr:DUF5655 domain-containing protein [Fulvivirga lutimaris]MTI38335.1 DUF91 domain-containing protein [Fulvivirga lutimaris]